nr:VWA domain-containing protein [Polyangiaceae bacterium]
PGASVEVIGTRFTLSALERTSRVAVSRGEVEVSTKHMKERVRRGEEATVDLSSERLSVYRTSGPTSETSLTVDAPGSSNEGFGELVAKKPGSKEEKKGAVQLSKHDVRVRISDAFARTEVEEVFSNASDEELEGIYRFNLPAEAQIERLALEVDGKLEDGAFVERDRGSRIWAGVIQHAAPQLVVRDDIIWVPGPWRDPALLEMKSAGRVELRIFPIPKKGSRKIVLAYTETLPSIGNRRVYSYPMSRSQTPIEQVSFDVKVMGSGETEARGYSLQARKENDHTTYQASEGKFIPSGPLTVEVASKEPEKELQMWAYRTKAPANASWVTKDHEHRPVPNRAWPPPSSTGTSGAPIVPMGDASFVAFALRPNLPREARSEFQDVRVVVDTSRSMFGGKFDQAKKIVASMMSELEPRDRMQVVACDVRCVESAWLEPSSKSEEDVRSHLSRISPNGSFDLVEVLKKTTVKPNNQKADRQFRVVYIGDGATSRGLSNAADLESVFEKRFRGQGVAISSVAIGDEADHRLLGKLTGLTGGAVYRSKPGHEATSAGDLVASFHAPTLSDVVVTLPAGAEIIAGNDLRTLVGGGEKWIYAKYTGERIDGNVTLKGKLGGEPIERTYPVSLLANTQAGNAVVARGFAAARIADLSSSNDVASKQESIAMSKMFHVASKETSLLVLESQAMFDAFGLKRDAGVASWSGEESTVSSSAGGEVESSRGDSIGMNGYGLSAGSASRDDLRAAPMGTMGPAGAKAPAAEARESDKGASAEKKRAIAGFDEEEMPMRRPRGRRMIPMRRTWVPETKWSFTMPQGSVDEARRALLATPDKRESMKKWVYAVAQFGSAREQENAAVEWLSRDPFDREAMGAWADALMRKGDRDEAIRTLEGIVDVHPSDLSAHRRLASLYERSEQREPSCGHWLSLGDLGDRAFFGRALKCDREFANDGVASAMVLRSLGRAAGSLEADRDLDKYVRQPDPTPLFARTQLRITADWRGGGDLDVSLVGAQGRRYSWLGGRANTKAVGAARVGSETIEWGDLAQGDYAVEITRARPDETNPIQGDLVIKLSSGETQRVSFAIAGEAVRVGTVKAYLREQLVPVTDW